MLDAAFDMVRRMSAAWCPEMNSHKDFGDEAVKAIMDAASCEGEEFSDGVDEAVRRAYPNEANIIQALDRHRIAKADASSPWYRNAA